jgi:hypothetical protein
MRWLSMACNFFKELYTADYGVHPQELLNLFEPKISGETNEALCNDFSEKEISDALFQIGPLKAPGSDGFPARFFQKNWEVTKSDVVTGV